MLVSGFVDFYQLTLQAHSNVKHNLINQTPQVESIYPPSLDTAPKTRTTLTKHEDLDSNNTALSPIQHPITTSTIEDDQHNDHELQSNVEAMPVEERKNELDNDLYAFDANLSLDNVDCDDLDLDAIKNIYGYGHETLQNTESEALLEVPAVNGLLNTADTKLNDNVLLENVESVEIPQSVDDRLMVSSSLTAMDNQIETLPETESHGEIEALEVDKVSDHTDSASDMEANNEISKVGLVDNDFLQGCQITDPDTYDDHPLKNTLETDQIAASVGCNGSHTLVASSSFELTDNQLSPFVVTTIPTNKDTNLTLEQDTTSDFNGSFESMLAIDKIVDDTLSEDQWNALPYYANQADLSMDVEVSYLVV